MLARVCTRLNSKAGRYLPILGLFAVLVGLYLLKVWEVAVEKNALDIWAWGLCRRVDDVSFWSTVALLLACFPAYFATMSGYHIPIYLVTPRILGLWLLSSALGIIAYLVIVCKVSPGTFCTPYSGTIWWIQQIEGVLVLYSICVGHFFFVILLAANWKLSAAPVRQRRHRVGGVLKVFLVFFATFMAIAGCLDMMERFCGGQPGWPTTGPKKWDCLRYVLAIWWPLLILAPTAVWNLQYLRQSEN